MSKNIIFRAFIAAAAVVGVGVASSQASATELPQVGTDCDAVIKVAVFHDRTDNDIAVKVDGNVIGTVTERGTFWFSYQGENNSTYTIKTVQIKDGKDVEVRHISTPAPCEVPTTTTVAPPVDTTAPTALLTQKTAAPVTTTTVQILTGTLPATGKGWNNPFFITGVIASFIGVICLIVKWMDPATK